MTTHETSYSAAPGFAGGFLAVCAAAPIVQFTLTELR